MGIVRPLYFVTTPLVFLMLLAVSASARGGGLPGALDQPEYHVSPGPNGRPAVHGHPESRQASDTLILPAVALGRDFEDIRSAVMGPDATLFVTDAGSGNLYTFMVDPDSVTPKVLVPGLEQPDGLSLVMDTYTAVVNGSARDVVLLDEQLAYMRTVTVPSWVAGSGSFHPSDVTSNEFGELFVLDSGERRIYHFNANGAYLQHFELSDMQLPGRLVYYSESLFIADTGSGIVHILTDSGRELASIGTFPELSRVRIIDDVIWVLSGSVIHLFAMTGEHIGNLKPENVSEPLRDVAGSGTRVFLLTRSSLYFWDVIP
jgi:hypothetical protein